MARYRPRFIAALALGTTAAFVVASQMAAGSLPPGYGSIDCRPDAMTYGQVNCDHRVSHPTVFEWYLDDVLQPETSGEFSTKALLDGEDHTLVVVTTYLDIGKTYRSMERWLAPLPMTATAPVQSARIARKRGILVRVTGATGFYRASSKDKRIPGSGNARITATPSGKASIRIKGSYLDRVKPGRTIRVEARHMKWGRQLEAVPLKVRFR